MLQNKKWTDFVIWENEVSIVLKDPLPFFSLFFVNGSMFGHPCPLFPLNIMNLWNVPCNLSSLEILTLVLWLLITNIVCLARLCPFRLIYLYFPTIWISWILIQHSQGLLSLGPSLTQVHFTNRWVFTSSSILQSEHMPGPYLLLLCK